MITFKEPLRFEWDAGNLVKNWLKHHVSNTEAEECFFSQDKRLAKDFFHSHKEDRYILIGSTKKARSLMIVFTLRKDLIRIISARDLNKKEKLLLKGD